MKKYEFTKETINVFGKTLHRIRAARDFSNVRAGDFGGFIESESNLSHDDDAWVYGDAQVYGNARVSGNAWVGGDAQVSGDARVCESRDIYWISCIGSRNDTTTFVRNANDSINVVCGCFHGTIDEFAAAVTKTHGDNEHAQAYRHAIEIAKLRIRSE